MWGEGRGQRRPWTLPETEESAHEKKPNSDPEVSDALGIKVCNQSPLESTMGVQGEDRE